MLVSPDLILPSQDFLKPETITYIFECLRQANPDGLPSAPVVRQNDQGAYVAIDGHNLIAVRSFRGEDVDVHVATSPTDGSMSTNQRDVDLLARFDTVIEAQKEAERKGIKSFSDLIAKYSGLFKKIA